MHIFGRQAKETINIKKICDTNEVDLIDTIVINNVML